MVCVEKLGIKHVNNVELNIFLNFLVYFIGMSFLVSMERFRMKISIKHILAPLATNQSRVKYQLNISILIIVWCQNKILVLLEQSVNKETAIGIHYRFVTNRSMS